MNSRNDIFARWEPRRFGAAEAERITGVSQHVQRDWRRRKIIGRKEEAGRVQYDPVDLAALALIQVLSRTGLPLEPDINVLHWGKLAITNAALRVDGAIEYAPSVPRALIESTPEYFHLENPPKLMLVTNFAAGPEGIAFEFMEDIRDLTSLLSGRGLASEDSFSVINFEAIGSKLARSAACPLFDVLELSPRLGAGA
ncbi:MerR family transcriptional regulator [Caulobacter sp. BP25]|uniref:MerR family transcriptional regulator n=1 Tax=Caulobacter sp. BP25 TaxID=2048900 RepID=UPI000C12C514|nr:MerR family transcriptional regulator [Caulobacter sp. BP25]PHY22856.1 hypothetical protein CSW59_00255 [Caulobacter sp. BP25]